MKKVLFLLVLTISFFTFSNDWEFGSEGEHLIPLESSNAEIKSEKIIMKKTKDGMSVSVRFVFVNPVQEVKQIGFITPSEKMEEEEYRELGITNFETKVNGVKVDSNIKRFDKSSFKTAAILKGENRNDYIYYFKAPFNAGENVVEHSYTYDGSSGIKGADYAYVITTISKWKNKNVGDFELIIDMGENAFFALPYSFWKDNRKIDWEIIGDGKIESIFGKSAVSSDESDDKTFVKIKNGYVRFKTQKFSPDRDIFIEVESIDNVFSVGFLPEKNTKYVYKDNLTKIYSSITASCELYKLSDKDIKILRNYPFAKLGYDFSNQELKSYFSKFFWYSPMYKTVELDTWDNDIVSLISGVEESRELTKKYLREDLKKYSAVELKRMKNLPYALRGYEFKDKDLESYYKNKYSWYGKFDCYDSEDGGEALTKDEQELIRKINMILK